MNSVKERGYSRLPNFGCLGKRTCALSAEQAHWTVIHHGGPDIQEEKGGQLKQLPSWMRSVWGWHLGWLAPQDLHQGLHSGLLYASLLM